MAKLVSQDRAMQRRMTTKADFLNMQQHLNGLE